MKFKLRYHSRLNKILSVLKNFAFALMLIITIQLAVSFFLLILIVGFELELSKQSSYIILHIYIDSGPVILCLSFLANNQYVKIGPNGILIHNCNFIHFGLGQHYRINITVEFKHIVNCKIEIPVDCPKNYSYLMYSKCGDNKAYYDYRKKVGVMKTKEPAIAGGRFDEECILLELDNKRIIVIPIDECAEFLDLFNQYFEQYKILESESSDLRQ